MLICGGTDKFPNGNVMTAEQIKQKWQNNSDYAKNTGTWMHYNIERYFNGLVCMHMFFLVL
jgi:hypothetical protein